jgi:membrane complex biogenesis BtpA family protein
MTPVGRPRANPIDAVFGRSKAIIGVIHSWPLPGAPRYQGRPMQEITDFALSEARAYAEGGVDGLIVENHGDIPFLKPDALGPETAACMAIMADAVRREVGLPTGINVLANGAQVALAVARAAGAAFIRVNQWSNAYVANEGIVEGPAATALRYRRSLGADDVRIFADVHVKHGAHAITGDRSIEELARDNEFFDADVAIATGQRTGNAATPAEIDTIKGATSLPVVVGSGVDAGNIGRILDRADGVIVASSLKRDGVWWNEVDPERLTAFMRAVEMVR